MVALNNVAIVNSPIIFTERCGEKKIDLKTFHTAIVNGLVGAATEQFRRERPIGEKNLPLEKRWEKAAHMPYHGTSRRCAMCSTKAEQHGTRRSCLSCRLGLCLNDKNCFLKIHAKK
jgi:hypothetical protein